VTKEIFAWVHYNTENWNLPPTISVVLLSPCIKLRS